jgi:hypothetical protein
MPDFDTLVTGLRQWTERHDPHVRAAVNLLIGMEYFLRDPQFTSQAVKTGNGRTWISWDAVANFADEAPFGSSSELAILRFAVALAEDKFRFSRMDDRQAESVVTSVQEAFGVVSRRA